jgi:hypothetical protein
MTARGVDLEITKNAVYLNGAEVLVADEPINISPVSRKHLLQATITLYLSSLRIEDDKLPNEDE